ASTFTASEWGTFFARDPAGAQGLLLPVRVAECDVDGLLGSIVYVDLVGLEADAARDRLLAGVREGRAKPASSPQYPGRSALPNGPAEPRFPGSPPPSLPAPARAASPEPVRRARERARASWIFSSLLLALFAAGAARAEDGVLVLHVTYLDQKPLARIRIG